MSRFSDLLGMAYRGRNAVIGRERVRDAIRRRQAERVFVVTDAGTALTGEMERLCRERGVPLTRAGTKEELGRALGRGEVAVVALTDSGLTGALLAELERSAAAGARHG